ncbi:hypothetical protein [Rathayibacter sp. VKM Ac-2857]|uniref:hypothetical protein n=1 Tax=Rathayibacter sp. VKM Ac-2857 TaxID=2739020 RepID=UPI0015669AC0|nr:hypothetical protein [Rathayibacter sp. VKM Ac-2857]NQX18290.1 hypothetical protein [Rathayibacter sp. VKM Ac-2857]
MDLVDLETTVDTALVTLLAGGSVTFRVTAAGGADPAAFSAAVRHANGLLAVRRG